MLVGIHESEAMRERLALLEDIAAPEAQLAAGQGIPQAEARARIMESIQDRRWSGATLRELIHGAYRVFCRVGSAVETLSVRHGGRLVRMEELKDD